MKKIAVIVLICLFLCSCSGHTPYRGGSRMVKKATEKVAFFVTSSCSF